jgi:hypothetical protein
MSDQSKADVFSDAVPTKLGVYWLQRRGPDEITTGELTEDGYWIRLPEGVIGPRAIGKFYRFGPCIPSAEMLVLIASQAAAFHILCEMQRDSVEVPDPQLSTSQIMQLCIQWKARQAAGDQ